MGPVRCGKSNFPGLGACCEVRKVRNPAPFPGLGDSRPGKSGFLSPRPIEHRQASPAGPSPAAWRLLKTQSSKLPLHISSLLFQRPLVPGDFPSPPHPLQTGKSSGARGRFAFWSVSGRPACALSFRACIPIVPRLGHGLAPHPAQPSGAIGHCRALLALATFSIAASSLCCGHVGKSFVCAPVCRKSTAIFAVENYLIFAV